MRAWNVLRSARGHVWPLACCALAACGSGDGFQGSGGASGPLAPNFDSIQANILEPLCEHCHAGANAPAGLRLDAANSYAQLVGIPSVERSSVLRVAPGDPNNSYIIHKLEGTQAVGERMPAGLPALPQTDINVVRQWIADGAQPSSAAAGPVRVTSIAPAPGSTLIALPSSITVGFNRELNAPSVTTATFRLQRSGPDRVLGSADDVLIAPPSVTVPAANQRSAVMDLTGVPNVFDSYRVTLSGTPPAAILDLAGNALDGEPIRLLPSGDGVAGGDYTATFTVAGTLATLTSIQDNVFTPRCAGCHTGNGPNLPQAMNLTNATASRMALVGVASLQVPSLQRVTAGNPNDSYLIRKLEGGPNIVANRMPLGGPFLDQAMIDSIRQWITNGAAQ
jgi:hypothetical protein